MSTDVRAVKEGDLSSPAVKARGFNSHSVQRSCRTTVSTSDFESGNRGSTPRTIKCTPSRMRVQFSE